MNFFIKTLGCKVNYHDSENLSELLKQSNFNQVEEEKKADFLIINSCTVTHTADHKSRQNITHFQKLNPKGQIIVMGCGVKIDPEQFQAKTGVGLVSNDFEKIVNYMKEFTTQNPEVEKKRKETKLKIKNRTRTNIKIQTGCDNYCAYCIIPFARGKSQSRPKAEIIQEIQKKEKEGFQEIVITGINIGAYGASLSTKPKENKFAELLEEILEKTKIPRIRLSSIGPQYFSTKLIEVLKNPRICQHLHLSIQSGSNATLKRMNRTYSIESVLELAEKLREKMPDIALSSDIIIGFPGETDLEFQETVNNLQKIKLMKTHLFPYSIRSGTQAAMMAQVEHQVKMRRKKELTELAEKMRLDFLKSQFGKTKEVLFETKNKTGLWEGYTDNYIRIKLLSEQDLENKIKKIQLNQEFIQKEID